MNFLGRVDTVHWFADQKVLNTESLRSVSLLNTLWLNNNTCMYPKLLDSCADGSTVPVVVSNVFFQSSSCLFFFPFSWPTLKIKHECRNSLQCTYIWTFQNKIIINSYILLHVLDFTEELLSCSDVWSKCSTCTIFDYYFSRLITLLACLHIFYNSDT